MSEKDIKEIISYLVREYHEPHKLEEIVYATDIDYPVALNILESLVAKKVVAMDMISTHIDYQRTAAIEKELGEIAIEILSIEGRYRASVTDRYYLIVLKDREKKLKKERDTLFVPRPFYTIIMNFTHYTVVGTSDTEDEYNKLRISCTLDYSVLKILEKYYYMQAVYKINDWFTEMFNAREVKISSEESVTLEEMIGQLTKLNLEVTDLAYDWWWERTGRSNNKEEKNGVIRWDEYIPLGEAGGWFTLGRKKK